MARIRTIKPELWTDPEFTECSANARLLFIAMLNFASDYGVLADKPRQIKMQCLPADAVEVEPLIDELLERQFVLRCSAPNGEKVLVIRTFTQHQKINRPSLGRWGNPAEWGRQPPNPEPDVETNSVNDHGELTEPSLPEGKGRDNSEGKGIASSSSRDAHLALVPPVDKPDDDDPFEATITLITDARCKGRTFDRSERGYRNTVANEARQLDGQIIRMMLSDGDPPEQVALFILGHGLASDAESIRTNVPWCGPACPTCGGDAWIDTGNGLAPCPNRTTEATA